MTGCWRLGSRVVHVTRLIRSYGFHSVKLSHYRPGPGGLTGWYRIEARTGPYRLVVTEYLSNGTITKYSYTLLAGDKPILRYDNAPHHPEVETHPHHKHVMDRVEPLHNPDIESFLEEAKTVIEQARTGKQPKDSQ